MEITPQVIIDKEFRVKFRGFDMAEVDAFLEEVAENLLKLKEENDLLLEKVDALEKKAKTSGDTAPGQIEFPAELKNFLEEIKQDTAGINTALASLKQDQSVFDSFEKKLKGAVIAMQRAAESAGDLKAAEPPADLQTFLQDFTKETETIKAELTGLKESLQPLASLESSIKEAVSSLQETAASASDQKETEMSADLHSVLQDFTKSTEEINTELTGLKEGRESFDLLKKNIEQILSVINESGLAPALQAQAESSDIKKDLQEMLQSHFDDLAVKLSQAGPALPKKARAQAEPLKAAIIEEEPEVPPEEQKQPAFEMEDEAAGEDELEFLSEDDILDVDKLRGVFQSVLDDSVSDAPSSREDEEDTSADLLFFDDDLLEVMNEPEVNFPIDEKKEEKSPEKKDN